jgi:hypothetical protein
VARANVAEVALRKSAGAVARRGDRRESARGLGVQKTAAGRNGLSYSLCQYGQNEPNTTPSRDQLINWEQVRILHLRHHKERSRKPC